MLICLHNLKGYTIATKDGKVSEVRDILFEDRHLKNHFLLSIIRNPNTIGSKLAVKLFNAKDIIKIKAKKAEIFFDSTHEGKLLPIETEDLEGKNERSLNDRKFVEEKLQRVSDTIRDARSLEDILGSQVYARDGRVGHLIDLIVDDRTWDLRFIAVDTESRYYPSNKSILPISSVMRIDWDRRKIMVNLTKSTVHNCPDYLHDHAIIPDISSRAREIIAREDT